MSKTGNLLEYYKQPDMVENNTDSFSNLHKIDEDFTVYVSLTGDDVTGNGEVGTPFATPRKGMEELLRFALTSSDLDLDLSTPKITLKIDKGLYTSDSQLLLGHDLASNFVVEGYDSSVGGTVSYDMTNVNSVTVDGGDSHIYDIVIAVDDVGEIEIDDYIIISKIAYNASSKHHLLNGAWQVTNVGSSTINFRFDYSDVWVPIEDLYTWDQPATGARISSFRVIKTVIRSTEENGTVIGVYNGKHINYMDWLAVESRPGLGVGDGTLHGRGIRVGGNSRAGLGQNIAVSRCLFGIEALNGGVIGLITSDNTDAYEGIGISSCVYGIRALRNSNVDAYKGHLLSISGCRAGVYVNMGAVFSYATDGSDPDTHHKISNCRVGLASYLNGTLNMNFATISHCEYGVVSEEVGCVFCNESVIKSIYTECFELESSSNIIADNCTMDSSTPGTCGGYSYIRTLLVNPYLFNITAGIAGSRHEQTDGTP